MHENSYRQLRMFPEGVLGKIALQKYPWFCNVIMPTIVIKKPTSTVTCESFAKAVTIFPNVCMSHKNTGVKCSSEVNSS